VHVFDKTLDSYFGARGRKAAHVPGWMQFSVVVEVVRNNCGGVLSIPGSCRERRTFESLLEVANDKVSCSWTHEQIANNLPQCCLSQHEMLSLLLYTGTSVAADLRFVAAVATISYQSTLEPLIQLTLNMVSRKSMYLDHNRCKWSATTQSLMNGIRKLDSFERKVLHRQHQMPLTRNYFHGLHNVNAKELQLGEQISYPTFISTSLTRGVAEGFKNGSQVQDCSGTIITLNESTTAQNVWHTSVSWISKFPQEHEVLFVPHTLRIEDTQRHLGQNSVEQWEVRAGSTKELDRSDSV